MRAKKISQKSIDSSAFQKYFVEQYLVEVYLETAKYSFFSFTLPLCALIGRAVSFISVAVSASDQQHMEGTEY